MSAPAVIYLVIIAIGLLAEAHFHGRPKQGKYNFWATLSSSVIGIGLLWWGGFFK